MKLKVVTSLVLLSISSSGFSAESTDADMLDIFDIDNMDIETPTEQQTWQAPRFTFSWSGAGSLQKQPEARSHRLDTRLRWEQLISDKLYANIDGKLIFRLPKDPQLDDNKKLELDGRLRELSLQYSQANWNIKGGFQTIVWGEMDSVRINDVMTPRDYSEPVFTNPEDARLGQGAIAWNSFSNNKTLNLIAIPWATTNRYPSANGSSFLSFVTGNNTLSVDDQQPQPGEDIELGMRFKYSITGSDLQLYAAKLIQDDPLLEKQADGSYIARYPSFNLIGASANYSAEQFLWKTELAFKDNLYFPGKTSLQRDTAELAIGFDYTANGAYDATVELMHQHIFSGEGELIGVKQDNTQLAARISKNFLYESLTLIYFASYQFSFGDITHSANARYAINDDWELEVNATIFDINDQTSPLSFTNDWDQASIKISYTY